jgi:hypothetical protein
MKSRHDELQEQFEKFDSEHPEVWTLFLDFVQELKSRGFKTYSVYSIFERIRWHTDLPSYRGRSTFKLNNNHRPFYARKYQEEFPEDAEFFRIRPQKSHLTPAMFGNVAYNLEDYT